MPAKDHPFDRVDASRFFNALWPAGIPSGHYLSIWCLADKTTWQFASFASLLDTIDRVQYGSDTYFGVGLSQRVTGRKNRPGKADISLVPGVWLDLDAKGNTTMQQLHDYISTCFKPTITVATGHGLQAYWVLDKPIPAQQAERLIFNFTRYHQSRAPFPIDSLIDTSRVLRLSGTWNYKQSEVVPCLLLTNDGPRYDLSELAVLEVVGEQYEPRPPLPDVLPESGGPYGGRDATLFKWIANQRHFGFPLSWTLTGALAINRAHFSPPLPDKLVEDKVKATYARYNGGSTKELNTAKLKAVAEKLALEMDKYA